jgi:hypothetical protein
MYSIFEVDRKNNRSELKQIKKIYLGSFPREERTPWFMVKQDIRKYKRKKTGIPIIGLCNAGI